ncbi:hypothetical protein F4054_00370 [Candidatus Poribacteria bacterium]|nr:hypothetical protein [Candidatus Poribacteria bacterium]
MPISPDDCVARFIRRERDCRNGIIKPSVFIPRNDDTEISVFTISGLQEDQIWELGRSRLKVCIAGRADLTVSAIYEKGLEIKTSNLNDRHAGIIPVPKLPFPDDSNDHRNETAKRTRRDIAAKLIAISRFCKVSKKR